MSKDYEELAPWQQQAVNRAVARLCIALGVFSGGILGLPKAWWIGGIIILYALIGLVWAAFQDGNYDDQTTDH